MTSKVIDSIDKASWKEENMLEQLEYFFQYLKFIKG